MSLDKDKNFINVSKSLAYNVHLLGTNYLVLKLLWKITRYNICVCICIYMFKMIA